jgi:hypothetical protein
MRNLLLWAVAIPLLHLSGNTNEPSAADRWASYRFLMGDWVGEGDGQSGQGKGRFSFAPDVQGRILVRKNRADFPASAGRPAFSHDDLLIIYQEDGSTEQKAIYFDSEGHVIHYTPATSPDGRTLTLVSEVKTSAPRYRLTYTKQEGARARVKFEVAPPGKPDAFKTYLEGGVRRTKQP